MDCQIRDISQSGCRIRVASTTNLPRQFDLQITGVAEIKHCEVRWRKSTEMGLQFVER